MRLSSVDDADARVGQLLTSDCSGKGSVQELSDCLAGKDDVHAVQVVMYGNGWRGLGLSGGSSGIAARSGNAESEWPGQLCVPDAMCVVAVIARTAMVACAERACPCPALPLQTSQPPALPPTTSHPAWHC